MVAPAIGTPYKRLIIVGCIDHWGCPSRCLLFAYLFVSMSGMSEDVGSWVPGGMIVKGTSNSQTRGSRQLDSGDRLARDETTEQSYSTLTLVGFASGVSRWVLASAAAILRWVIAAWCRGLSLPPSGTASPQHSLLSFGGIARASTWAVGGRTALTMRTAG